MAITVLARFQPRPESIDEFLAALTEHLPATRAFAGCSGLAVIRDVSDPTAITLIEEWESEAAHRRYGEWRAEEGTLRAVLGPLLVGPTEVSYHEQLRQVHWG